MTTAWIFWIITLGAVFVVSQVAYDVYLHLQERRNPFRYIGVPEEGLQQHLREFYRRGFHKAKLCIRNERTGKQLFIEKRMDVGLRTSAFRVTADGYEATCAALPDHVAELAHYGVTAKTRTRWAQSLSAVGLVLQPDWDVLQAVCHSAIRFQGAMTSDTYEVWVRGTIHWADVTVDHALSAKQWRAFARFEVVPGKPYKHWQAKRGWAAPLGHALGRLCRRLTWPFARNDRRLR